MNGNVTCENCWWYGANEKAEEIIKKATNVDERGQECCMK